MNSHEKEKPASIKKVNTLEEIKEYKAYRDFVIQYHDYYKKSEEAKDEKEQVHFKKLAQELLVKSQELQYNALKAFCDHKIFNRVPYLSTNDFTVVKVINLALNETKEQVGFTPHRIFYAETDRNMKDIKAANGKTVNRKRVFKTILGKVVNREINPIRGGEKKGNVFSKKTSTTIATYLEETDFYDGVKYGAIMEYNPNDIWFKANHIFSRNMTTKNHWNIEGSLTHHEALENPSYHMATTTSNINTYQLAKRKKRERAQQNEVLPGLSAISFVSVTAMTREWGILKPINRIDKLNALYLNYVNREIAAKKFPDFMPLWQHVPTYILESKGRYPYSIEDQLGDFDEIYQSTKKDISYERLQLIAFQFEHKLFEPSIRMYFAIRANNQETMHDEKLMQEIDEEYPGFATKYYDPQQKAIWCEKIFARKLKNKEPIPPEEAILAFKNNKFIDSLLEEKDCDQSLEKLLIPQTPLDQFKFLINLISLNQINLVKKILENGKINHIIKMVTEDHRWNILEFLLLSLEKIEDEPWVFAQSLSDFCAISKKCIDELIKLNRFEIIKKLITDHCAIIDPHCAFDLLMYLFNKREPELYQDWLNILDTRTQLTVFKQLMQQKKFILAADLFKQHPNLAREKFTDGSSAHHLIAEAKLSEDNTYDNISEHKIPNKKIFFQTGLMMVSSFKEESKSGKIVQNLLAHNDLELLQFLVIEHIGKFSVNQLLKIACAFVANQYFDEAVYIIKKYPKIREDKDIKFLELALSHLLPENLTNKSVIALFDCLTLKSKADIFKEMMQKKRFHSAKIIFERYLDIIQYQYEDDTSPGILIENVSMTSFFKIDYNNIDLQAISQNKTLFDTLIEKKEYDLLIFLLDFHINKFTISQLSQMLNYLILQDEFTRLISLFSNHPQLRKESHFRFLIVNKITSTNQDSLQKILTYLDEADATDVTNIIFKSIEEKNIEKISFILKTPKCVISTKGMGALFDFFIAENQYFLAHQVLMSSIDGGKPFTVHEVRSLKKPALHMILDEEKPNKDCTRLIKLCSTLENLDWEAKDTTSITEKTKEGVSIFQRMLFMGYITDDHLPKLIKKISYQHLINTIKTLIIDARLRNAWQIIQIIQCSNSDLALIMETAIQHKQFVFCELILKEIKNWQNTNYFMNISAQIDQLIDYFLLQDDFDIAILLLTNSPQLKKEPRIRILIINRLTSTNQHKIKEILTYLDETDVTDVTTIILQSIEEKNIEKISFILKISKCIISTQGMEALFDFFVSENQYSLAHQILQSSIDSGKPITLYGVRSLKKPVLHLLLDEEKPNEHCMKLIESCRQLNLDWEEKDAVSIASQSKEGMSVFQRMLVNGYIHERELPVIIKKISHSHLMDVIKDFIMGGWLENAWQLLHISHCSNTDFALLMDTVIQHRQFAFGERMLNEINNWQDNNYFMHIALQAYEEKSPYYQTPFMQIVLNKDLHSCSIDKIYKLILGAIRKKDEVSLMRLITDKRYILSLNSEQFAQLCIKALKFDLFKIAFILLENHQRITKRISASNIVWYAYQKGLQDHKFVKLLLIKPGIDFFIKCTNDSSVFDQIIKKRDIAILEFVIQKKILFYTQIIKYYPEIEKDVATDFKLLSLSFDEKNLDEKEKNAERHAILKIMTTKIKQTKTISQVMAIADQLECKKIPHPWAFLRKKYHSLDMSAYGEISTVWVGLIHIAQNKIIELSTKNVAQIKPAYQEVLKFLSLYPPMGFLFSKQSLVEKYKVNVKHPVGSRINTPRKEY